jgi:DNA-binding winged helix-turn-helix (wHTH) protein
MDARSGELRRDGATVHLPPQPFKVLWLLASRAGEVVTREEIRQELWGNDTFVDFDGGLNFCINQIRKALRDSAESPRFVHTLPRRGYRFIAGVESVAMAEATATEAPSSGPRDDDGPAPSNGHSGARLYEIGPRRVSVALDVPDSAEAQAGGRQAARTRVARARPSIRWMPLTLITLGLAVVVAASLARRERQTTPRYERLSFRRGLVSGGRFAPDGQVVYSAAWDGGPSELFAARPGIVDSRSLGTKPAVVQGVLPSGEIAVLLYRDKTSSVLARLPPVGGAPRQVRENLRIADWLRDDVVAVVTRQGLEDRLEFPMGHDVYNVRAVLSHLRICPDGLRVAFLEHPVPGDDRGDVVTVDRRGGRTVLSGGWASLEGLAWSADGGEVWFTGTRVGTDSALNAVSLRGRERVVTRVPGRLVLHDVAPDGRVLLDRTIRRLEVKGLFPDGESERDLSWLDYSMITGISGDGSSVVISESGEGGGPGYGVFFRSTDGSPPVRLGEGRAMSVSPDGRWVLAIPLTGTPRILALPTGPGEPRSLGLGLTGHAYAWAGWFPDSRRIVFHATHPGRQLQVFVQDLDGGVPRAVTPEGMGAWRSVVSNDGARVLAHSLALEPGWLEYPVDGGRATPVNGLLSRDRLLTWSDDGRWLYVMHGELPVVIERIDVGRGTRETVRELRPADPAGASRIAAVQLTPDGGSVAYTIERVFSDLYVVTGLR